MPKTNAAVLALGALGDPTRRTIFERLAKSPMNVGEITDTLHVTRSAVSQHLRIMKQAKLVTEVAQGTRRIYRLDPRGIGSMRDWLDNLWGNALDAFRDYADAEVTSGRRK